jgi:hypothetical protein
VASAGLENVDSFVSVQDRLRLDKRRSVGGEHFANSSDQGFSRKRFLNECQGRLQDAVVDDGLMRLTMPTREDLRGNRVLICRLKVDPFRLTNSSRSLTSLA